MNWHKWYHLIPHSSFFFFCVLIGNQKNTALQKRGSLWQQSGTSWKQRAFHLKDDLLHYYLPEDTKVSLLRPSLHPFQPLTPFSSDGEWKRSCRYCWYCVSTRWNQWASKRKWLVLSQYRNPLWWNVASDTGPPPLPILDLTTFQVKEDFDSWLFVLQQNARVLNFLASGRQLVDVSGPLSPLLSLLDDLRLV